MLTNVLYRGPLERSRLSFLTECAAKAYGGVRLIWINPRRMTRQLVEHFQEFIAVNPWIQDWEIVDGLTLTAPAIIPRLGRVIDNRQAPLMAVGLTAIFYAAFVARGKYTLCINGIPEERLLHTPSWKQKLYVFMLWRIMSLLRSPELVVTVSEPMGTLVKAYWPSTQIFAAPNCVNRDVFAPPGMVTRSHLTYLGSGAPWQALDKLAPVWGALYQLDRNLRFRVISRDERTRILAEELPAEVIEFKAVEEPEDVARLLWEARIGFIIREPHLVNTVSFPTKFGEYVAAGVSPIVTDLGWDLSHIIKKTGCGILIPPHHEPTATAQEVIAFLNGKEKSADIKANLLLATEMLDRQIWVEKLGSVLPQ